VPVQPVLQLYRPRGERREDPQNPHPDDQHDQHGDRAAGQQPVIEPGQRQGERGRRRDREDGGEAAHPHQQGEGHQQQQALARPQPPPVSQRKQQHDCHRERRRRPHRPAVERLVLGDDREAATVAASSVP
jgi:hypothetical protein